MYIYITIQIDIDIYILLYYIFHLHQQTCHIPSIAQPPQPSFTCHFHRSTRRDATQRHRLQSVPRLGATPWTSHSNFSKTSPLRVLSNMTS